MRTWYPRRPKNPYIYTYVRKGQIHTNTYILYTMFMFIPTGTMCSVLYSKQFSAEYSFLLGFFTNIFLFLDEALYKYFITLHNNF